MPSPLPLPTPAQVGRASFEQRYADVLPLLTAAGVSLVVEMAPQGPGSGNWIAFCGREAYQFTRLCLLPAGAVAAPGGSVLDSPGLVAWLGQQLGRWAQLAPPVEEAGPDVLGLAVTILCLLAGLEGAVYVLTGGLSFAQAPTRWLLLGSGAGALAGLLSLAIRRWYRGGTQGN